MKKSRPSEPLIMVFLIAAVAPCLSFGQCPVGADTCSASIHLNTIEISTTQVLSGAYQCFHVLGGGDLNYDGAFSTFLVESGGTVNANGTGNLVLAKSGASVGFCGSGYANTVYHEAGTTLTCMTGNTEHTCGTVVFDSNVGVMGTGTSLPILRFDPTTNALHVPSAWLGLTLQVTDMAGRTVIRTTAQTQLDITGLPPGSYVAELPGVEAPRLQFMVR